MPDLTIILKVRPKICIQRIAQEKFSITLFEKEEKLKKVWQNFKKITKRFKNVYVIGGENSIEKIAKEVAKIAEAKVR